MSCGVRGDRSRALGAKEVRSPECFLKGDANRQGDGDAELTPETRMATSCFSLMSCAQPLVVSDTAVIIGAHIRPLRRTAAS